MKYRIQCLAGDVPVLGEAVHHATDLFSPFLAQQPDRVLGRRAGVNDQRLFRLAGSPDVNPETLALPVQLVLDEVLELDVRILLAGLGQDDLQIVVVQLAVGQGRLPNSFYEASIMATPVVQ